MVKVLSNNNYVVRRTGTRYTQTLHRIRPKLYAPIHPVPDVTVKVEDQLPDPDVKTTHDDWYAQAWETEFGEVLFGQSTEKENEEVTTTEVPTDNGPTTENEAVITTAEENLWEDKTPSGYITSFNLDVSNNLYIMTPPPTESPPVPPTQPPIVDGYNLRQTGRYNPRPNPRPNAHPDFRIPNVVTTDEVTQTHD